MILAITIGVLIVLALHAAIHPLRALGCLVETVVGIFLLALAIGLIISLVVHQ